MNQAIPPDAANYTFDKSILPRASQRSEHLFDAHAFNTPLELAPIDRISIPQQMLWRRIPRKGFNDLLAGPLGSRVLCKIEVHDLAAMMRENHQDELHPKSHGGYHEEIDGHQVPDMIAHWRRR